MPAANRTVSHRHCERSSRRHLGGKPELIGAVARRSAWIVPFVWWVVVSCPGFTQELVNPDFDTDLTGWGVAPPPSHSWSPVDHEDDPASGSLLAVKDVPGGGLLQATQCLEIEPGEGNSLTAMVLVPASSDPADFYLGFSYYSDSACQNYLDFDRVFDAPPLGEWAHFTFGPSFAPPGALSAEVALSLYEAFGSTVPVTAHIDAVRIFIFTDGFESSDTGRWSSMMPSGPTVVSVSPTDGEMHVPALTPITIIFSEAMNPTTITVNTVNTDCTGTIQLSDDGFSTCFTFAGQPFTGDDITFTAAPASALASATTYQIRVTTDAEDPVGNPLIATYTTPVGFTVQYTHAIVIDGVNDFDALNEEFVTSTSGGRLFVSYDDAAVYVALEHPDILPAGAGTGDKYTLFLFSTDAGLSMGNVLSSDGKVQFGAAGTDRMLYHWKERIDGPSYTEYRVANGVHWGADWGSTGKSSARGDGFVEASFALTEFGGVAPADLIITAYTVDYNGAGGEGWIYNMLAGATDGPGATPRPVVGYVHLQLPSSYSPNEPGNLGSF